MQRIGGTLQFQINGEVYAAKGEFTYNLGRPKRKVITGTDNKVHGYTEESQPGFIEGTLTDTGTLDVNALVTAEGVTATLTLANGKLVVVRDGVYAGEGTVNTSEGEIDVRIEGEAEEVS